MFSKILVPLDGSALSEGILPYARRLARVLVLPVELLRVNEAVRPGPDTASIDVKQYLEKVAATFFAAATVKCTVQSGAAADAIVEIGASRPDTLIAMATHGYSGAKRWVLGSVAEKVVYAGSNNLLLVRPTQGDSGGEALLKKILVPLDGSELAEKILPTAIALAARLRLPVALVHVLIRIYFAAPDTLLPVFGANYPRLLELWEQARAAVSEYLAQKEQELRAKDLPGISSVLIDGSAEGAAAAIIDLAKMSAGTLVAMSTHGWSGIGRWVMGSVTERVVRHSGAPVLVMRPQSLATAAGE